MAGTASGPKDIVDTIAKAGSAAIEAATHVSLAPALSAATGIMGQDAEISDERAAG